jgi:AraC family transcriptional regulator
MGAPNWLAPATPVPYEGRAADAGRGEAKFFGRVVARGVTPTGANAIVEHDIARPLPAHDHRSAYFCLLARGGYAEIAGRRFDYQPGTVLFHPESLHHRDEITRAHTRLVVAEVASGQLELLRDLRAAAARDVVRCEAPAGILMSALEARLLAHAGQRERDRAEPAGQASAGQVSDADGRDDDADDLLFELLGVVAGAPAERAPGSWLASALELMHEEVTRPLRVTEIAARVGVHPVRLARAIRRRYRCSVSEHLHTVRIERACQALRATDTPVVEIAASLGYADQSHFTRVFASRVGLPPSRFRAALR